MRIRCFHHAFLRTKHVLIIGLLTLLTLGVFAPARAQQEAALRQLENIRQDLDDLNAQLRKTPADAQTALAGQYAALGAKAAETLPYLAPESPDGRIRKIGNEKLNLDGSEGFYPSLYAGYSFWEAAQLTKSEDQKADYYAKAYSALRQAYNFDASTGKFQAFSRNPKIYQTPLVLRILVSSALGSMNVRAIRPEELLKLFVGLSDMEPFDAIEIDDLTLDGPHGAQRVWAEAAPLDEQGHELNEAQRQELWKQIALDVQKKTQDVLNRQLQIAMARKPVDTIADASGEGKQVVVKVNSLVPLQLALVDPSRPGAAAITNAPSNRTRETALTLRVPEASQAPLVDLLWKVDAPGLSNKYRALFEGRIAGIRVEAPPQLALLHQPNHVLPGRRVGGDDALQVHVKQAHAGDVLIAADAAGKELARVALADGESDAKLPDFLIPINAVTNVSLLIQRPGKAGEAPREAARIGNIAIQSEAAVEVAAELRTLPNSNRPILRVQVKDYSPVRSLMIGGIEYRLPEQSIIQKGADGGADTTVYLIPLPEAASGMKVDVRSAAGKLGQASVSSLASRPVDEAEVKQCLLGLSPQDPRRILALGTPEEAQAAFEPLLRESDRSEEARKTLEWIYSQQLNHAVSSQDRRLKLAALKGHAELLGKSTLASLISLINTTPRDVLPSPVTFDAQTGLALLRFRVKDQTEQEQVQSFTIGSLTVKRTDPLFKQFVEDGKTIALLLPKPAGGTIQVSVTLTEENGTPQTTNPTVIEFKGAGNLDIPALPNSLRESFSEVKDPLAETADLSKLPPWLQDVAVDEALERFTALLKDPTQAQSPQTVHLVAKLFAVSQKLHQVYADTQRSSEEDNRRLARVDSEIQSQIRTLAEHLARATTAEGLTANFRGEVKGPIKLKSPVEKLQVQIGSDKPIDGVKNNAQFIFDLPDGTRPDNHQIQVTLSFPELPSASAYAQHLLIPVVTPMTREMKLNADSGPYSVAIANPLTDLAIAPDKGIKSVGWDIAGTGNPAHFVDASQVSGSLKIDATGLAPGEYTIDLNAWSPERDPLKDPPVDHEKIQLSVLGPAVALIVGNDYYDSERFSSLSHSVDDARAIKKLLLKLGYLEQNIIYVFGSIGPDKKPLLETNALTPRAQKKYNNHVTTKLLDDAEAALTTVAQDCKAEHAIVFYAGHGTTVKVGDSVSLNAFVCYNGETRNIHTSAQTIGAYLSPPLVNGHKTAPTIIGIYDACRSAALGVGVFEPSVTGADYFPVSACKADQHSNENGSTSKQALAGEDGKPFANGFFTYSLITAVDQITLDGDLSLGNVLDRAGKVLKTLMTQAQDKNLLGDKNIYSQQDIKTSDDLTKNQSKLPVFRHLSKLKGLAVHTTSQPHLARR